MTTKTVLVPGIRAVPVPDPEILRSLAIHPIRSEEELDRAIAIVDAISDKPDRSPEELDYRFVIAMLIEEYESQTIPEPEVSGLEMLRYVIEESGRTQAEISRQTGIPMSSLSEILSGKRGISKKAREKLGKYFVVDGSLFA